MCFLQQERRNKSDQCLVWSEQSVSEMCALKPDERIRRLRTTFLFSDLQPISLYSVFAAGSNSEGWSRRLLSGVRGSDCVRESGERCNACFNRLATALRRLDDAYRSFDQSWYKRWLLVQTVSIWREPPCVNWCYYAQLACPHLATSKVVDYAGHPSFQCREGSGALPLLTWAISDLDIPLPQEPEASRCGCVHPCDLRGIVTDGDMARMAMSGH
ncbi:unnamed protein product, partial [Cylicostephanus goldi]